MTVKRVRLSYHVVKDMSRAVAFYQEGLGLALAFADGDRWAQFSIGDTGFALASPAEAAAGGANAVIVFEVNELEPACDRAIAAGGRLIETRDMGPHGSTATMADPDGNVLQFFARGSR